MIDLISGFKFIRKEPIASAIPHMPSVLNAYGVLSDSDLETMSKKADPYLVAHGIELSGTIVTNEKPEPNRTKPINKKVPDICKHLGVRWVRYPRFLWEMQRGIT